MLNVAGFIVGLSLALGQSAATKSEPDLAHLRETLEDRVLQADVSKRGPEVVAREHDWMAVATRVAALCGRVA